MVHGDGCVRVVVVTAVSIFVAAALAIDARYGRQRERESRELS